ncbi:MAG TPA: hypothetical protein VKM35_11680 [Arenimonas sp.]|uniref:hypothetical protein n=1 Tax=Arenimonas sp. TaxID=1872635 RepID=UPI002C7E6676|nr:hypothetical protein [Arenimonas sp.]HMB57853.1 hypothetical protein [Arenimonas sp.]
MLESLRPSTLLLGTVCAWALLLLGLTIAGLGGRIAPAPSDLAPEAIPAVKLTRSESGLGPLSDYLEVGARPLLLSDRKPAPILASAGDDASAAFDAILSSVMITPQVKLAILTMSDGSSRRVKLGEAVAGTNWSLQTLEPRRAVFAGPGGAKELALRVFDGKSGAAPTPIANTPPATPAPSRPDAGINTSSPNYEPPPIVVAPAPATAPPAANPPTGAAMTQEQQIEAIRARIEARRASARAEALRAAADNKVK